jgi:predicted  nucleic acid-binding Zn-ribbon protein
MENKIGQFVADLMLMEQQIEVLNNYLQALAERERRMKSLQIEIDQLRGTLDELRRHA